MGDVEAAVAFTLDGDGVYLVYPDPFLCAQHKRVAGLEREVIDRYFPMYISINAAVFFHDRHLQLIRDDGVAIDDEGGMLIQLLVGLTLYDGVAIQIEGLGPVKACAGMLVPHPALAEHGPVVRLGGCHKRGNGK